MSFGTLPNLIALAVLVGVFWAISRRATTEGLHLWLAGWALVLLHFVAEFAGPGKGVWAHIVGTVSLNSLLLAAIVFVSSVCPRGAEAERMLPFCVGVPAVAYATAVAWDVGNIRYYHVVFLAGVLSILVIALCRATSRLGKVITVGGCTVAASASTVLITRDPVFGLIVILAAANLAVAFFYWKRYRRYTAGVMTAVGGFVLWASVFPAAAFFATMFPASKVDSEVWNIPKYLVAVGMILTLFEDHIRTSKYFAFHDELTGLPNRRLLEDRLEQALAYAHRNSTKLAVLILDLDHFKAVNDTYGHPVGDIVLRETVARLTGCLRPGDTLARSGGDEFTVISHVTGVDAAEALRLTLQLALSPPIAIAGAEVHTGLSIGLALYPENGSDPDELCAAADRAMYAMKRAAHNPVEEDSLSLHRDGPDARDSQVTSTNRDEALSKIST